MTGQTIDLVAIRRRLPDIPREDMSRHEEDRADLLAEVDRLTARAGEAEAKVADAETLGRAWVRNGVMRDGGIRIGEVAAGGRILLGRLGLDVPPLTEAERKHYADALADQLEGGDHA